MTEYQQGYWWQACLIELGLWIIILAGIAYFIGAFAK